MNSKKSEWKMRKFLSRQSVAKFFDTSSATIDRWVRQGVIPSPLVIGGVKRWDIDDLMRAARDAMGAEPEKTTCPDEATRRAIESLKGSK